MQKVLFEYDKKEQLKPEFTEKISISESVRNATYQMIKPDLPRRRQEIFAVIIANPGITARKIEGIVHRRHHTFSGRISELYNKNGKYGDKQYIEPCGVEYYPDDEGKMQPFTKWRPVTI